MIIKTGISTTIKSAQSKKCRSLEKVRNGQMTVKVLIKIREVDPLLAQVMTIEEILAAGRNEKPSRGGGRNLIEINIDDE